MHESSASLRSSPRSIAHSSTAKAAPRASPIFPARFPEPVTEYNRSGLKKFNLVGLTSPNPVGDSGIYLLRTRGLRAPSSPIPGSVRVDSRPSPKALSWMGSYPTPKSLLWVDSNPSPKALSWVGSCPALNMLPWVGSLSPLPRFTIFAHTSHIEGLTAFQFPRGDSSLVFLPPSPLPKAVPAAGRFHLPPTLFSLRLLSYPSRAARAPQKTWLQRRPSHSRLIYPGVLSRRRPPPRPPVRLCPSPPCLALQPLRRRRRAD